MNKLVVTIVALVLWFAAFDLAFGAMTDEDGKVIDKQYDTADLNKGLIKVHLQYGISDVVRHCSLKGYFIYNNTIYQCVKIREGITQAELRAYARKEKMRLTARYQEILKQRQDAKDHK